MLCTRNSLTTSPDDWKFVKNKSFSRRTLDFQSSWLNNLVQQLFAVLRRPRIETRAFVNDLVITHSLADVNNYFNLFEFSQRGTALGELYLLGSIHLVWRRGFMTELYRKRPCCGDVVTIPGRGMSEQIYLLFRWVVLQLCEAIDITARAYFLK